MRYQTGLVVLLLTEIGKILPVLLQHAAGAEYSVQLDRCGDNQVNLPPPPWRSWRRLMRGIRELNWPVNQRHAMSWEWSVRSVITIPWSIIKHKQLTDLSAPRRLRYTAYRRPIARASFFSLKDTRSHDSIARPA